MAVKFFADSMLGKLARWLRLLGFDTLYYPSIPDDELVGKARKEKRIILTKDADLFNANKYDKFIYVTPSDPYQQIKLIIKKLNLDPWEGLFSRCVHCNYPVEEIKNIEDFKDRIPPHSYRRSSSFYYCPVCDKVYWEGSHHQKVRAKVKELLD